MLAVLTGEGAARLGLVVRGWKRVTLGPGGQWVDRAATGH